MLKSIVGIVLLAVLVAAAVAGFVCLKLGLSMNADTLGVDTAWPSTSVAEPQNVRAENENNDAPKKEHLITVTIKGTDEFDGVWFLDRPLSRWEKMTARGLSKIAKENGGGFTPPPDPDKTDEKK